MKALIDYQGRAVRLTDERLQHILEHPEMVGLENLIEQTLRSPQRVVRSRTDPETELHYRLYFNTMIGDKWMCVVVRYRDADAFVLTAYLTDKPKTGEVLWPKT